MLLLIAVKIKESDLKKMLFLKLATCRHHALHARSGKMQKYNVLLFISQFLNAQFFTFSLLWF
jgi:hypothetical protein